MGLSKKRAARKFESIKGLSVQLYAGQIVTIAGQVKLQVQCVQGDGTVSMKIEAPKDMKIDGGWGRIRED
jgi:hypothetical protein